MILLKGLKGFLETLRAWLGGIYLPRFLIICKHFLQVTLLLSVVIVKD